CGLDDALLDLERLRFGSEEIDYLRSLNLFDDEFLSFLARLEFSGDVWAIPEGEAVFAQEPLLRVTAPLIEAQLLETFLINCIGFQTLVASKAARVTLACGGRSFADFSARRDHGADAALKGARAAYVGGAASTSMMLAGRLYGIPVTGTMAHSFVMTYPDEEQAFRAFARAFPESAVLLIDTYDTVEGARKAVRVAAELASEGIRIRGVRLDSGNLEELAASVRAELDDEGFNEIQIFASGDLDEHAIADLLAAGAPIDAFGVGTRLGTSEDAPNLGMVYKLVEDAAGPKIKLSSAKATPPGRKQVHRFVSGGHFDHDVIALADEEQDGGRPLLEQVMADGRRTSPSIPLLELQATCLESLDSLPENLRGLDGAAEDPYPVQLSKGLEGLLHELTRHHTG
ncbi:MAG: nicotinate phosphoribosyltransferase, partial [Acidimicrobiia bacterium]